MPKFDSSTDHIADLSAMLKRCGLEMDADNLADLLWLSLHIGGASLNRAGDVDTLVKDSVKATNVDAQEQPEFHAPPPLPLSPPPLPVASLQTPSSSRHDTQQGDKTGLPFQTPGAKALRRPLVLGRSLRPLMRKYPSRTNMVLDEEATANVIAERGFCAPVLKPAPERWLSVALVIEETRSTSIWRENIQDFRTILEQLGAFRNVRAWSLHSTSKGTLQLFSQGFFSQGYEASSKPRPRPLKELLDPSGRSLVLVMSDCTSAAWRRGTIHPWLQQWSQEQPVALVQFLPERFWDRSALGAGISTQLRAFVPGVKNAHLVAEEVLTWEDIDTSTALKLPIVTLEPESLFQWAQVMAGVGSVRTAGVLFEAGIVSPPDSGVDEDIDEDEFNELSAEERVTRFRATASPTARRLAGLMAAAPVNLTVIYLIQAALLPASDQVHVAEVFMSGLLKPVLGSDSDKSELRYDFVEGVRDELLKAVPISDVTQVQEEVSQYIARRLGISIRNFTALLTLKTSEMGTEANDVAEFATLTRQVLHQLGGEYARYAEQLEGTTDTTLETEEDFDTPEISEVEKDDRDYKSRFPDVFISYGRADSKQFAKNLNDRLVALVYKVWLDVNDIPLGVDYQKQIDDAIERSKNFVFIISPHSVNSPYNTLELEKALKLNKRVIPILHVEQVHKETWQQRYPQGTEQDWVAFQASHRHSAFPNMHPAITKINWLYFREDVDDFENALHGLINVLSTNRDYVHQHTVLLNQALTWESNQKRIQYLLIGEELQHAKRWLLTRFQDEQAPCTPTDLQSEFITESIKNANNLMTQVFLCYADNDQEVAEQVRRSLWRECITVWTKETDIETGAALQEEIERGIEQADNLIYLVSPDSAASDYCQHELEYAISLNKRVIPILVKPTDSTLMPQALRGNQYVDLTDNQPDDDFSPVKDQLLRVLRGDAAYYETHKILLVQTLKWERQQRNPSILLRGYSLRQAEAWLKVAQRRSEHSLTDLQKTFIEHSLAQPPLTSIDVFISYSRIDSGFARKLNEALQIQGKSTWFDQVNILTEADFPQEIYRGIEASDHFLFILSPQSVQSSYCADEVQFAAGLNKRILTVLYQPVDPAVLHPELAKVQWIDFSRTDFLAAFSELFRTLDIDIDVV